MGRRTIGAPKAMREIGPLEIESVDLEAQGVAHFEGKVVFVAGALAGERVDVEVTRERPSYIKSRAIRWHRRSSDRVEPPCAHYGVCGGCSMQHAGSDAQVAIKQRVLEDALWHIGQLRPQEVLVPIRGPSFAYRSRARLSVRWVDKKGGLILGFRERASSYVTPLRHCPVLQSKASMLLPALRDCMAGLDAARAIPQVELAAGDGDSAMVWVVRHLEPLSEVDRQRLANFADAQGVCIWLQPGGPATAAPMRAQDDKPLSYELSDFGLRMPFSPVDFTQVNFQINRALVRRAIGLLEIEAGDRVIDFFCGLGNFSLAIAQRAGEVVGIEGSATLVEQAMRNASALSMNERVSYKTENLFEMDAARLAGLGIFQRALIDPPREGAQALCEALASQSQAGQGPIRMVMVSCNPATLARDAAILVHQGRWQLSGAGMVNMFPQTAHVESIAVFDRLLV